VPATEIEAKGIRPEHSPDFITFVVVVFIFYFMLFLIFFLFFPFYLAFLILLLIFYLYSYFFTFTPFLVLKSIVLPLNIFSAPFHLLPPLEFSSPCLFSSTFHHTTPPSSTLMTHWLAYCTNPTTTIPLESLTSAPSTTTTELHFNIHKGPKGQ
jgi:hypothetical protein